jgi:leucine dehydrogenase
MFELLDQYQVNELHVKDDISSGLKAFIAIHNTNLGPALGGCRFIDYDHESDAIQDVTSLARSMSYKAALAGLPQGGGKAVIMKPMGRYDRFKLFKEFGRFVDSLNGRYITAVDSGTSSKDMDIIQQATPHVSSTSALGNPSISTAAGVFEGIKAAVKHRLDRDDLHDLRVAIQGVGNVGMALGQMLNQAGAKVIVADICRANVEAALNLFASESVEPGLIHKTPCTVFSPCGLSNVINDQSIDELGCLLIAGSANVQLSRPDLGKRLHDKGILYAPDYVINSGGLIYASLTHQYHLNSPSRSLGIDQALRAAIQTKISKIQLTLLDIFTRSYQEGLPTSDIADVMAIERLGLAKSKAA